MFLDVAGLDMHVRLDGPPDAPPLVMLHSLGTDLRVWDPQADALAARYRVIRPDLRGHGLSAVPPGPYSVEMLADDVLGLLDRLAIGRAHVAGLSLGGMVAQALAYREPARIASLMLCDTALAIPPPALWRERAALVRAAGMAAIADAVLGRWVSPDFARTPAGRGLRAMLLRTAREGYSAAAEAIAVANLEETTSALRLPALVLVADGDQATPRASAEALCRAIPGARLREIRDAAHIPTWEQPEGVVRPLSEFLDTAAKSSGR